VIHNETRKRQVGKKVAFSFNGKCVLTQFRLCLFPAAEFDYISKSSNQEFQRFNSEIKQHDLMAERKCIHNGAFLLQKSNIPGS